VRIGLIHTVVGGMAPEYGRACAARSFRNREQKPISVLQRSMRHVRVHQRTDIEIGAGCRRQLRSPVTKSGMGVRLKTW